MRYHSSWGWIKCKLCDGNSKNNTTTPRTYDNVVQEEVIRRQHDGESVHSSELNSGNNPYWKYWESVDNQRKRQ